MNMSKLKQRLQILARLFDIEPNRFSWLIKSVYLLWLKAEAKRLRHPRKIKRGSERRYGLTLEKSLAMLLLHTRTYTTHIFLSALFNTHESSICRYFAQLRPSVEAVFNLPIKKTNISEEEILELIIDATERRTEQKKTGRGYSGKEKTRTIKTQIAVNDKGAILHISDSVPGNVHDKKLFEQSGITLPDTALGDWLFGNKSCPPPFKASKCIS